MKGDPEPPDWLSEEELEEFARYVDRLKRLRVLSATDDGLLAMAAVRRVEIKMLSRQIAEEGNVVEATDRNHQPILRPHPAVGQRNTAMRHLQSLEASMGLTPSDRGRVSAKPEKEDSNPYATLKRHG